MSRANFHETVSAPIGPGGALVPLAGISLTPFSINTDGSEGSEAGAYAARTGSTAASTLVTDSSGYVSYWLDLGDYNIHVADTESSPRITSYIQGFCASVLTPDALITAAENVLFFTGDVKFSLQTADHGLKIDSTYEWLLVASAGDGGGRSVSQANYPNLWSRLGSPAIDVGGNFRLPNLSGRVLVASGDASGLSGYTLLEFVGEENHTLSIAELATHSHTVDGSGTGVSVNGVQPLPSGQQVAASADDMTVRPNTIESGGVQTGNDAFVPKMVPYGTMDWGGNSLFHSHPITDPGHAHTAENTGSGSGHNNVQPSAGMNLFIKT